MRVLAVLAVIVALIVPAAAEDRQRALAVELYGKIADAAEIFTDAVKAGDVKAIDKKAIPLLQIAVRDYFDRRTEPDPYSSCAAAANTFVQYMFDTIDPPSAQRIKAMRQDLASFNEWQDDCDRQIEQ
ncbi:MAG TPA: hypothetical protein PLG99_08805 [Kaistiaceae bacterium]|nr:hypothetical protein [Kaistiaceae bacterium]